MSDLVSLFENKSKESTGANQTNTTQQNSAADSSTGLLSGFGLDRLAQEDTGYYTANEDLNSTYYTANEGLTNTSSSNVLDSSEASSLWRDSFSSGSSVSDLSRSDSTGSLYSDFSDIDTRRR